MTKIETDIYNALLVKDGISEVVDGNPITAHNCEVHAIAAAKAVMKHIENAWYAGYVTESIDVPSKCFDDYLKRNGL